MQHITKFDRLFVGIDVHKDNHAAVVVDCFSQPLAELKFENSHQSFKKLISQIQTLTRERRDKPIFGLEDTYGSGEFLARFLWNSGFEVKIINPVLVRRERNYETHPEKSDLRDALGVARVLIQRIDTLPTYSITESAEIARDLHALVKDRETLIVEQTRLKNQLHRYLHHSYGSPYRTIFKNPFSKKALTFWQTFPSAQVLACSRRQVAKPDWIKGVPVGELPFASTACKHQITRKARRLLAIREELSEIETELQILLGKTGQYLHTLSGCGPVLAAVVLSEIKDISRFRSPAKLAKYAGLTPRAFESGKQKRHIRTKSGNRRLNCALFRIALTQISNQGIPKAKTYFQKKIREGKSKRHALLCLERQIIDIIWSMLKDKRPYYP